LFAKLRLSIQVLNEGCFVSPTVELFQCEHPKESVYLVARRASVAVVDSEIDVVEWILADKLLD